MIALTTGQPFMTQSNSSLVLPVMNHSFSNFAHRPLCDRQLSHKVVHTEFNLAHILRVSNSPWVSREGVCNQLLLPCLCPIIGENFKSLMSSRWHRIGAWSSAFLRISWTSCLWPVLNSNSERQTIHFSNFSKVPKAA